MAAEISFCSCKFDINLRFSLDNRLSSTASNEETCLGNNILIEHVVLYQNKTKINRNVKKNSSKTIFNDFGYFELQVKSPERSAIKQKLKIVLSEKNI